MPIIESSRDASGGKSKTHRVEGGTISSKDRPTSVEVVPQTAAEAGEALESGATADSSSDAGATSASDASTVLEAGGAEGAEVSPADLESDSSGVIGAGDDASDSSSSDSSGQASGSSSSSSDDSDSEAEDRAADAAVLNEPQGALLLSVPKQGCLKCGHFNTEEVKFQTKCHFTQGYGPGEPGEECPAREFQIRVAIPKEKIAKNLAEYQVAEDIESYQRVSNKLTEYSRAGKITPTEFREIKAREQELVRELEAQKAEARNAAKKKKSDSKSKDKDRKHKKHKSRDKKRKRDKS